jgi:hypothetical protein
VTLQLQLTVPSYIQDVKRKHSQRMLAAVQANYSGVVASSSSALSHRGVVLKGEAGYKALDTSTSTNTPMGTAAASPHLATPISLKFEGVDPSHLIKVNVNPEHFGVSSASGTSPPVMVPLLRLERGGRIRAVLLQNSSLQTLVVHAVGCKDRAHYPSWLEVSRSLHVLCMAICLLGDMY